MLRVVEMNKRDLDVSDETLKERSASQNLKALFNI